MSAFATVLGALPPIRDDIHAIENAEIVKGWLVALREGRHTEAEFDAQIQPYHLFQYAVICGPRDPYFPDMVKQIDRRMHLRGLRFCKWRGWVKVGVYDDWRRDGAVDRARLPNKERAA